MRRFLSAEQSSHNPVKPRAQGVPPMMAAAGNLLHAATPNAIHRRFARSEDPAVENAVAFAVLKRNMIGLQRDDIG